MIDEEEKSRPVNSRTGFEGIDVGVQFKSLGALVYYISSPVNQKSDSNLIFALRNKFKPDFCSQNNFLRNLRA